MSRTHKVVSGALLLGAVAAFAACDNLGNDVVRPKLNDSIFSSYVALGNSITAGYQSGGINDSTQKQSYAVLLAQAMGTRFAYPSLVAPGCPPPINNLLTGGRVGGTTSTSTTCNLRTSAGVSALINNVAVPGIASADPIAVGTAAPNANALMQLFLGGESMVQKALDNRPTFATVWVGNNDILAAALGGLLSQPTSVATFISNYSKDINALVAGAPTGLRGVLIGVVQVAGAPIMISASQFTNPAGPQATVASQIAGRPVFLDPTTCTGANLNALINFQAIAGIKSRPAGAPGAIVCQKTTGGASDPGDNGVLDVTEQATVAATINAYNAYIKAKADSIGFAYYDPNVLLTNLRADSTKVPRFPVVTSTTAPFGQYISFDGVHPAAAAHVLIANDLIDLINSKYQTSLVRRPTS